MVSPHSSTAIDYFSLLKSHCELKYYETENNHKNMKHGFFWYQFSRTRKHQTPIHSDFHRLVPRHPRRWLPYFDPSGGLPHFLWSWGNMWRGNRFFRVPLDDFCKNDYCTSVAMTIASNLSHHVSSHDITIYHHYPSGPSIYKVYLYPKNTPSSLNHLF